MMAAGGLGMGYLFVSLSAAELELPVQAKPVIAWSQIQLSDAQEMDFMPHPVSSSNIRLVCKQTHNISICS